MRPQLKSICIIDSYRKVAVNDEVCIRAAIVSSSNKLPTMGLCIQA
jgi:hypothetical protein